MAAPAAVDAVDPKAAFRELKALFPAVSRSWLRKWAHMGVPRISNFILDNATVPETRYEHTADEGSDNEEVPAGPPPAPPQQQQQAAQQQQQQQQQAAAADDGQAPFVMDPIQRREKCSIYPCRHKPLRARVLCHGPKRSHTLCIGCCTERAAALRPMRTGPGGVVGAFLCPVGRCGNTVAMREMLGVADAHAPPLAASLRARVDASNRQLALYRQRLEEARQAQAQRQNGQAQQQQQQQQQNGQQQAAAAAGGGGVELEAHTPPAQDQAAAVKTELDALPLDTTPVSSRASSQLRTADATTPPRVARRLSQITKPIFWTPSSGRFRGGAIGEEGREDPNEEEPAVEGEAADELRAQAAMVDRERLKKLQACFPATAVGWLVSHADYGIEALIEMVTDGEADLKQLPRADGKGATTIVEETMAARVQFECSVCFCDYDEHLAITCVWLEKRRQTLAPGEEGYPTDEELAAERADEAKGRSETHKFCADCVRGHAGAAVEQQVIMHAGVGIKCMEPSCKNALLRAHIEQVLDKQTRAILDPLFSNEALLAANCEDVEKCERCPFAGVMLFKKEVQPIFKCEAPDCGHMHCRKCGRGYPEHKDRTCEELDPEAVRRRVEEQLTEAAMFKCPRCKRGIVKSDGCNKIACPCGQLSCYVCKKAIQNYKHFKNGPAEERLKKCPLWVDPTAKVEAARQDMLQQQIAAAPDDETREQLRQLQ